MIADVAGAQGTPYPLLRYMYRIKKEKVQSTSSENRRANGVRDEDTKIYLQRVDDGWLSGCGRAGETRIPTFLPYTHTQIYIDVYIYISPGGKAEIVLGAPVKTASADVT